LLAAVCLLGTLSWTVKRAWVPALTAIVALGIVFTRPLPLRTALVDLKEFWPQVVAEHGICDEGIYYCRGYGLLCGLGSPATTEPLEWATEGRTLRVLSDAHRAKLIVVVNSTGIRGYNAGPKVYILDDLALSDPLLARLPPVPDPFWRIGHFNRWIPDGYLATLRGGENVIRDPKIAEYYDHLRLITQGGLWDRRRWATIWNMNLGRYEGLLQEARRTIRTMPPMSFWLSPGPAAATEELSRRIALRPQDPAGYRCRGAFHAGQQQPDRAIADFSRAIELEPDNGFAYCSRAAQYARRGVLDQALADYNRAIELKADLLSAYNGRGNVRAQQARKEQALADYNRAVDFDPDHPLSYSYRGMLYVRERDWQRAASDFEWMTVLQPLQPLRYHLLACTLARAGKLEAAYQLKPAAPGSVPDALVELAWVLATHPQAEYRDGAQALRYAEAAMSLRPAATAALLDVLAASYAEIGEYAKAVDTARQAIARATAEGDRRLVENVRARLQLYQANQPYHLSPPAQ
jgi:tetratricopeptide (TPR) repeat protein